MAKLTWQNVRLFTGAVDLTTVNNKVEVKAEAERQDATAFTPSGSAWVEKLVGLRSFEIAAEGQWEALDSSKVDNVSFGDFGVATPWTIAPLGANVGDVAYMGSTIRGSYELGGAVGDVAPWSADGDGASPLVRGFTVHPPGTARTATGTGTAQQVAAVPAGSALYLALHVTSVSGATPSITVRVESDDNVGFASPVTVGTANALTVPGYQWLKIPGPITDNFFRVAWTISGTTPSFLFLASLGIG